MWQTDWAEKPPQNASSASPHISGLAPEAVRAAYLLSWAEHCIECAVPDCYQLCPLYVGRRDRKCARFKYGIVPNPQYPGLFPYGAEIEFRRWGKLESNIGFGSATPNAVRAFDRIDRGMLTGIRPMSSMLRRISPYYRINGAYSVLRESLLQGVSRRRRESFDEFVIEVWNLDSSPVRLVLECWQGGPRFRTSITLEPGRTMHRIPAETMNVDLFGPFGVIRVYPENDAEAHLVFSWLDFVKYREAFEQSKVRSTALPAAYAASGKVKCVIWDLDRTVWDGILGERDPEGVTLRADALRVMLALDERGILQSIASKNDHDTTWRVLERVGVAPLFLHPQINWEPKSVNVQRIISALNIGADSCVFIDDSLFERAEVAHEVPGIRIFSDTDIANLLERPEFDVPVTKESQQRRAFYVAESERQRESQEYGDRYESFLRTCKMEAQLFRPVDPEQVERCLELLHRSNQLNLSTYRYTREELAALLNRRDAVCVATSCRDRFGDYGIVGFASVIVSKEELVLKDFVLSCRVAQKKLENAWFKWLSDLGAAAGYGRVQAAYTKTSRNGVLLNSLMECGFVEKEKKDAGSVLELDTAVTPPSSDIVLIASDDFRLAPLSSSRAVDSDVRESKQAAS
jgi:FkbH-like protein